MDDYSDGRMRPPSQSGLHWEKFFQERPEAHVHYRETASFKHLRDSIDRLFYSGSKVIDIGCGLGELVLYMNQKGISVIGVDRSCGTLSDIARKLSSETPKFGSVLLADCRQLPLRTASLDGLVSLGLLEHFKQHRNVLLHWLSLLKPGANVLLQVPNGIRMDFFWYDVLVENLVKKRRWVWPRLTLRGWASNILGYEERWWPGYFKRLLQNSGVEVTRAYSVYPARLREALLLASGKIDQMSAHALEQLLPEKPPKTTGLLLVLEGRKV